MSSTPTQEHTHEEISSALCAANKLIGEAADEASRLQKRITELEGELEALDSQIEDLERDVEFHRGEAADAEANEREAKKELDFWTDAFVESRKMQCAVHDFLREQGHITDPARDVPFHSAPTVWQTELDKLVESVTP